MKLSLWQQFSGNHSGWYTVVGLFKTPTTAQNAYAVIVKMIEEIDAWNQQHPPSTLDLNPVEQAYERLYGIKWQEAVDWLLPAYREAIQSQPTDHVVLFDQIVFIEAPQIYTYQTGHQFADLMQALGAETYDGIFMGFTPDDELINTRLGFRLDCTAPTEAAADEVYEGLLIKKTQHKSSILTRDEMNITLEEPGIQGDMAYIISSLVSWMRALGCTVTYHFRQVD